MGEHVRQADERGFALDLGVVVALDRRGDRRGQPPAPGEHAADERVIDAQLAPLLVDAVLGRPRAAMDLRGIAGVGVQQHQLADVVQQARGGQAVAVLEADLGGDPVGRVLRGESACRRKRSGAASHTLERSKKSNVRRRVASACTVCGVSSSTAATTVSTRPRPPLDLVGQAQHGDEQRDVGLDRGDHVGGRHVVLGDDRQQPVARLGQGGKRLERFEGHRQAAAVTLVLVALTGGGSRSRRGRAACLLGGACLPGGTGLPGFRLRLCGSFGL